MAWSNWNENKSSTRGVKFSKSCLNGLREIFQNRPTLFCGLTQALFEAVISIFVFLWGTRFKIISILLPSLSVSTDSVTHRL